MPEGFRMVFVGPSALDLATLFYGSGWDGLVRFGPPGENEFCQRAVEFLECDTMEDAEIAASNVQRELVEAIGQCERCLVFVDATDVTAAGSAMVVLEAALYCSKGKAGIVLLDHKRSPSPLATFVQSKMVEMRGRSWIEPLVMVDADDAQLLLALVSSGHEHVTRETFLEERFESHTDDLYGET